MVHELPLLRVHTDAAEHVLITCPRCSFKRSVDASPYKSHTRPLKVGCKCKFVFMVEIEFRKFFRKDVMLPGEFKNPKTGEKGEMLVSSLSLQGIAFSPLKPHTLSKYDFVVLRFTLNDINRSLVERKAVVRSLREDVVGAKFTPLQPEDRDLNFYLMPGPQITSSNS